MHDSNNIKKIKTADLIGEGLSAINEQYGFTQDEILNLFKREIDVDWLFNKLKEHRLKNHKVKFKETDLVAFKATTEEIREFFLCDYAPLPNKEIFKIKYLPFLQLNSTIYPISIIISFYLQNKLISTTTSEIGEVNIFIQNSLFLSYNIHGKEIKDVIFSKNKKYIAVGDCGGLLSILNLENSSSIFRRSKDKKFRNKKFQYVIFKLENSIEVIHWTGHNLFVVDNRGFIHLFEFYNMNLKKIKTVNLTEKFVSVEGEPSLTVFCISHCNRYLLLGGNWCGVILVEFSHLLKSNDVLYIICDRVVDISARSTEIPHFIISTVSDVFVLAYEKNIGSIKRHGGVDRCKINSVKLNREIALKNNSSIAAFFMHYNPNINIMQGEGFWYRREIKGYFNEESIIFLNGRFAVDFCIIPYIMRTISVHEHNAFILSNGLIAVEHYGCICTAHPVNSFNKKIDKKMQKNKIALFSLIQTENAPLIAIHPHKNIIAMGRLNLILVNLHGREIFRKDNIDLASVDFSSDGQYLLYSTSSGSFYMDALYGNAFPLEGKQSNSQHNLIEQVYNTTYYAHKNYANNMLYRGEIECGYKNENDKLFLPLHGNIKIIDAHPVDSHGGKAKYYVHNDYAKLIEHNFLEEKKSIALLNYFYLSISQIIKIEAAVYNIYKNFDVLYDVIEGEAHLACMLANLNGRQRENVEVSSLNSTIINFDESSMSNTEYNNCPSYDDLGRKRRRFNRLIIPDSESNN